MISSQSSQSFWCFELVGPWRTGALTGLTTVWSTHCHWENCCLMLQPERSVWRQGLVSHPIITDSDFLCTLADLPALISPLWQLFPNPWGAWTHNEHNTNSWRSDTTERSDTNKQIKVPVWYNFSWIFYTADRTFLLFQPAQYDRDAAGGPTITDTHPLPLHNAVCTVSVQVQDNLSTFISVLLILYYFDFTTRHMFIL